MCIRLSILYTLGWPQRRCFHETTLLVVDVVIVIVGARVGVGIGVGWSVSVIGSGLGGARRSSPSSVREYLLLIVVLLE